MSNTNLLKVQEIAENLKTVENVRKELKKIQSIKCRLGKQKSKPTYQQEMTEVLAKEKLLQDVRKFIEPKKLTVTTMTAEDIATLNYEETIKAIKSIQSKKCNTQYLTDDINNNVEYQSALKIEAMLLEHKATVKPVEETVVKKSEINDLLNHIEELQEDVSKEYLLEQLRKLTGK